MRFAGPLCWVIASLLGCGKAVVEGQSAAGQGGASSATQAASDTTSQTSASASSAPASSSGTGASPCEAAPDCYLTMGMNSADCSAYDTCRSGCNQQQDCIQACGATYRMGVDPWSILAECVLCGACPNDCAAYASELGFSCGG